MKNRALYFILICGILFFLGRFFYYTEKIKDVCHLVGQGSAEALKKVVDDHGLQFSGDYSSHGIIHTTKNLGRGVCLVKIENGIVKEAIYDFRD